MSFTIPKPKPPVTLWLFGFIVLSGLAALWLAAFNAFSQVVSPAQAFFAALTIEGGAVVEAFALTRSKNWMAILGAGVMLAVSGVYNYIQVSVTGAGMPWVELIALAVGPLIALTFLSASAGKELSIYENRVKAWEEKRQTFVNRTAKVSPKLSPKDDESYTKVTESFADESSAESSPESFSDWRKLPEEDRAICAKLTTEEIRQKYGVSPRTALNWYGRARANGHKATA